MATKDQERKALAQIMKIVEGLGAGSYIGMAFEGCFEIARENIENDFACSMKQRAESAEKKLGDLGRKYDEDMARMQKQIDMARAENELAKRTLLEESERAKNLCNKMNDYKTKLNDATDKLDELSADYEMMHRVNDELEDEIEVIKASYEQTIIELKAKLYDMMVK